jgi:anti-sigma regulatory factor (Ser/Thr protein kinase)/Na+-translocating ferredoxin:NAD+ oxidoreductase RNF subunit RnfB
MNTATHATYEIRGGDYARGGAASKQLKEILKKLGVEARTIRRTMVAAYEAEMNTVIHARGGAMRVAVDASQVDVVVEDEGPGIPDVQRAMTEGFSTAPAAARALGFGAGMGLPNIRKNADRFSVQTVPGKGTQVRFRIFLEPQQASQGGAKSIEVVAGRCRRCLLCVHACPTGALRVREEGPEVLDHLCIDCASCMDACRDGALTMGQTGELPTRTDDTVLVVPAALLEQFGAGVGPEQVLAACRDIGFKNVRLSDEWERALRKAVADHARDEASMRPVLSPMCPAVVNLIRVRFPSLLGHLAPFLTPMEAAREGLTVSHAAFVALCPAQMTALRAPNLLSRIDVVPAPVLCSAILPRVESVAPPGPAMHRKTPLDGGQEALQVSGMRHVEKVLNEVEDGLVPDCQVLELFGCDQGCFGSPVWTEDPFVARRRYEEAMAEALRPGVGACAIRRTEAIGPRSGLRLDPDMAKAIEKLRRIDALTRELPGRDCGACGAPTCAALAEDIVLGRACVDVCLHRSRTIGEKKQ